MGKLEMSKRTKCVDNYGHQFRNSSSHSVSGIWKATNWIKISDKGNLITKLTQACSEDKRKDT